MDGTDRQAWFRPKRYGYGAEPASWKGWLATGIYLAILVAIVWRLVGVQTSHPPAAGQAVLLWAALIAVTLAFVVLCWMKTEGKWRWRWGQH